jgi:hypothetical protein
MSSSSLSESGGMRFSGPVSANQNVCMKDLLMDCAAAWAARRGLRAIFALF